MKSTAARVYVVDDDPSVRKALTRLLRSAGLEAESFGSANEFLAHTLEPIPSCLVLDVWMPGLTGPELQRRLKEAGSEIPVIFLTGHGDVPMTARAMKVGAVDVLTKPLNEEDLLQAVHRAIAQDKAARADRDEVERLRQRLVRLTPREREVFSFVIAGLLNKQIAAELGTSLRTVKVHRGRVMGKMEANSIADLVRFADRLGVVPACPAPRAPTRAATHRDTVSAGSRMLTEALLA